jgi:hypothetical protein
MTVFLVTVAITLRIFGSFHDALNTRRVGWFVWHLFNWVRRDAIIAAIVWRIHGAPWSATDALTWWVIWLGANAGAHKFFYWLGDKVSFWLLTKHKY